MKIDREQQHKQVHGKKAKKNKNEYFVKLFLSSAIYMTLTFSSFSGSFSVVFFFSRSNQKVNGSNIMAVCLYVWLGQ